MSLYDRAKEGMTKIEGAITGLPVIKDYRGKDMRRDADKRLRERISQELENYRRKLSALQLDMVSSGNLRVLPEMERAVGRLQLLIDRIRTAAYGYAPFFDIEEIREDELDRLAAFDQQMAATIPVIDQRIDALGDAIQSGEGFGEAMDALMGALARLHEQFDKREQVISFVTGDADTMPALDEPDITM